MAIARCSECGKYLFTAREKQQHRCHPVYYVHNLEDETGVEEAKHWLPDDFPLEHSSKRYAMDYADAVEDYCKVQDTEYQVGFFDEPGYFAVYGPDEYGKMSIKIIKIMAEPEISYSTDEIEMAKASEINKEDQ